MTLETHLKQVKSRFVMFGALLLLAVGGTSLYFGSQYFSPQAASRVPDVNYDQLELSFRQLSSLGVVAGSSTLELNQRADSVPVLVYHGIEEGGSGTSVAPERFYKQMQALYQAGWRTVGIEDFAAFVRGERTLPAKSFLLTFDDGRKDSFYPVDPVLRVFGFRAVMYVITGNSLNDKTTYYLNRSELAYMRDSGRWDLQAHAQVGHDPEPIDGQGATGNFLSNRLWRQEDGRLETGGEYRQRVRDELTGVKSDLEREFGISSVSYAFPYGDYGQDTDNQPGADSTILPIVADNYRLAFTQYRKGMAYTQNYPENGQDFYLGRRLTVAPDWDETRLLGVLEAGSAKGGDYQEDFANGSQWVTTWGEADVSRSSGLKLWPSPGSNGAAAFLDGGKLWDGYSVEAVVDFDSGESVSLMLHYQDDDNYTACVYSKDGVVASQRTNGVDNSVSSWRMDLGTVFEPGTVIGASVSGTNLICRINGGEAIDTPRLSDQSGLGSVGFKVWDPEPNRALLTVRELRVEPNQ